MTNTLTWWPGLLLAQTGAEADVSPDVGPIMDHLDTIVKTPSSCEVSHYLLSSPCRHRQVVVGCQMVFINNNNIGNLMFRREQLGLGQAWLPNY